jgi:gliding motility-associated-like protein
VDLDQTTTGIQSTFTNSQGAWSVSISGDVTYNPMLNFNGTATISYTVNDNNGTSSSAVSINVIVIPINDPPIIVDDNHVAPEDAAVTFNVTGNDTDVDGTVDPATVDLDVLTIGIQNSITNPQGSWSVNGSGDVTFTPVPNFNGTATLTYTVNDNSGSTSLPGTISVHVNMINDKPVAVADAFAMNEDTSTPFNITANDIDVDGTIDASSVDLDPAATGVQKTVSTPQGTWNVDSDGDITFVPTLNFNGNVSASYVVRDNNGDVSNPIPISLTINPVNDAPIMNDDAIIATQDLDVTGNILTAADSDPDGTSLIVNTTPVSGPNHGALIIDSSGAFTYTSAPGFIGTDVIVLTVCDGGLPLPAACSTTTLTISVVLNQNPTISTKRSSINEDFPFNGNVLNASDFDPEGLPLVVNTIPVSGPNHGTVTINSSGSYVYTPTENFNGVDTVKVQICDTNPTPACSIVNLIVTVNPVNDAPVLLPDIGPGERNEIATGFILLGDLDPDSTQLTVTTVPVAGPSHGSIVIESNGNYTYTPDHNFIGDDEITIEVCDNGSPLPRLCAMSTLTMRVTDPLAGVVFVPEGFSPNDDGANDRFEIVYTGSDPIHLEVYNRWGNLVYAQENYQNDWDGVATRGVVVGSQLPDGTYFYKVSIGNYKQVKSFTLQR